MKTSAFTRLGLLTLLILGMASMGTAQTQISSCQEFESINNDLTDNYELTTDLNCNGNKLEPIGYVSGSGADSFSGVFEGNGHTISNFDMSYSSDSFIAPFTKFYGEVYNLKLKDYTVKGNGGRVAGFAARSSGIIENVSIENVYVEGSNDYLGGFSGYARSGETNNVYLKNVETNDVGSTTASGGFTGITYDSHSYNEIYFVESSPLATNSQDDMFGDLAGFSSGTPNTNAFYYDSTNTDIGSTSYATALTTSEMTGSSATNNMNGFSFGSIWLAGDSNEYPLLCGIVECNILPKINSTSISPDPALIGESVSYSAQASDSDGSITDLELTIYKGGSQVYQNSVSSASNTWSDVYTPQSSGNLDARFVATDDAGATTTEWLNRTLTNTAASVNITEPKNGNLYGNINQNYEAEIISSGDSYPNESINYTVNLNSQQISQASNNGDFNISGSLTANEGSNTLKVTADDGVNQASESISFDVDTTPPSIDILSPESFEPDRTNVQLEANVSDPNLNNCYYNLDGGTNQSLPSCDTAQLSIPEIGSYTVNVYAEDTVGNTGNASKTFTADYVNEIRLEDSVSGSSIQEFQVGFKANNSQVGAGGSTSNGEFLFNTSELPNGSVNATFTASGYNTKTETFQVDNSFTLNQTFAMERAGIFIQGFEENSQDQIDFDLTAVNDAGDTYSEANITTFEYDYNNLPSGFPEGELTLTIDDAKSNYNTSAEYDQFRPRKYIIQVDENTKTSLDAYLLERGAGIFVTVEVSDGEGERLPGALVNIQRNLGNNYKTVSSKRTATDGTASYYLDPDTVYQALVSKSGYSSFSGTFSPVNYQAEALQIALGTESTYTRSNTWDSIEYDLQPQDSRLNLTGMQSFNFSATDTESGLEEVGVRLYNQTGSKVKEHSVTGSPSGMSSEIDVNLSNLGLEQGDRLTAVGYFVKEGEGYEVQRTYTTRQHIVPGLTSLVTIFDNADGLGDGTKGMIALLISIVTGAGLKSGIDKKGAGMITLGVLGIFVMVGWFNSFFFLLTLFMLVGLYGTR